MSSDEFEKDLAQAGDRIDEALALRDQMVSLKSRDLKGPIEAITADLKTLEQTAGELPQQAQEALRKAIDRCDGLIAGLDKVVRIGALKEGGVELHRTIVEAQKLIRSALGKHFELAAQKGIDVKLDIGSGRRLFVDPVLFTEAITSLVENSLRFCPSGSALTIAIPDSDSSVIITDNGPGASFPEGDLVSTRKKSVTAGLDGRTGLGLGLPLCADIMKLHGGQLAINTSPGKGCSVILSFPVPSARILIVDDHETFRMELQARLEDLDAEIVEAASGKEAITIIAENPPQLVITDLMMEEVGGFELLEYIRKNPKTSALPVIVVTATEEMETRDLGFRLGASDYVQKPIVQYDFLPRVRRFLPS